MGSPGRDTHEINELPEQQTVGTSEWISKGVRASDEEIEELQSRWEIPENVGIIADLGHNLTKEEVIEEAINSIEAGASALHIHILGEDGTETTDIDVWREVLNEIKGSYPDIVIDGGFRGDTFDEQMEFIREGFFDLVSFARTSNPDYLEEAFKVMDEHDVKPKFTALNSSYIQRRSSLYVDSGMVDKPTAWSVNIGNPYMGLPLSDPESLAEGLLFLTKLITDADPDAVIFGTAQGVYSNYIPAQMTMLGHHMRVGMGETRWRFPHKTEKLTDNQTAIEDAATIAKSLGRSPATPSQFRDMLDM